MKLAMTKRERDALDDAAARVLADETDWSDAKLRALESAREKLDAMPDLLEALTTAVKLLRTHVEPDALGGTRFDLTDCRDMRLIFAVLSKAVPAESANLTRKR